MPERKGCYMKIYVDPGHGGTDPGACGKTQREKNVTLEVARSLRDRLEEMGHTVLLSRYSDADVPLSSRTCKANEWEAEVYLSIHCNGAANHQAHGFEVWTSVGLTEADALASHILEAWRFRFPSVRLRQDWADGDGDKESQFWVLAKSRMPAVLVELGFITNPNFEEQTENPQMIQAWARALAEGIGRWTHGRS